MTAALEHARGDAVIPIDVDLQDPPELIHELIAAWQGGAEVVLARRTDRQTDTFLKRRTASLFYRLHNRISQVKIPEDVGDFRLLDRAAVDALAKLPERQRFMKGLFAWIGFRTAVVNYTRASRAAGTTKFSGWKLWNFALEGITSFSATPLKIWTYMGGIGALLTLLYALFIIIRVLVKGIDVPGYASLLVAVLFFGSLQLIGIGVLGEYIGRIYMESKRRPTYLIRRLHEYREIRPLRPQKSPWPEGAYLDRRGVGEADSRPGPLRPASCLGPSPPPLPPPPPPPLPSPLPLPSPSPPPLPSPSPPSSPPLFPPPLHPPLPPLLFSLPLPPSSPLSFPPSSFPPPSSPPSPFLPSPPPPLPPLPLLPPSSPLIAANLRRSSSASWASPARSSSSSSSSCPISAPPSFRARPRV